jgi:hypothetical protein
VLLPAYAEGCVRLGPVPWQPAPVRGVWRHDGLSFTGGPRGPERPLGGVPRPFEDLCHFLKGRPGVEAMQAVAFPVQPNAP